MNEYDINDKREQKEFTGKTFSNYKKGDAKKQLLNSLKNNKIEDACYWSGELICAGHFLDLWEYIIEFIGKNINVSNVKLPMYLETRINCFVDILKTHYIGYELSMRNNKQIRELFAEIICVLCQSKKRPKFEKTKISAGEFNMHELKHKLKAPTTDYAKQILQKEDAQEILIAVNELCYNISKEVSHFQHACYWIDWLLEYERIANKNKQKLHACRRVFVPIDEKLQMDIIWIVWDCILSESRKRSQNIIKINSSILSIFCLRFTPATKNKRRYLIYYAISLLTEPFSINNPLISNTDELSFITQKINFIYKQIKKKEIEPATSYMFSSNGEKTKEDKLKELNQKLDIYSNMSYIPRQ